MDSITFSSEHQFQAKTFALGWAVLLKDYIGSPTVSFYLTDYLDGSSSPAQPREVHISCDTGSTLGHLYKEINAEDSQRWPEPVLAPKPRTNLCILDAKSLPCLDLGIWDFADLVAPEDTIVRLKEYGWDLMVKCVILEQGRAVKITILSHYGRAQSTRLLAQFQAVLHQVNVPGTESELASEIRTISNADLQEIWKWNAGVPKAGHATAVDVLSDLICSRPGAPAIDAWDGQFTYEQLDKFSSILARHLLKVGVRSGTIVPLCFEKTKWTPVSIVAVIRTGAAFVLLDEDLPEDRLQQLADLIADETQIVLASNAQQDRASLLHPCVLVVDSQFYWENHTLDAQGLKLPLVKPTDNIYIVFTSGTTGVPKAALLRHSNVTFFTSSVGQLGSISGDSRILALASYSWDVSLGNVFLALLNGSCICIPSSWECKNDVVSLVDRYKATHVLTTPSLSKLLSPSKAQSLDVLDLGGEPCTEDVLAQWRGSRTRVMNTYGPAECTVESVVNPDVLSSPKASIIGRGLGVCWIMDPVHPERLSPIGGIGELFLEGPMVGGGYLDNKMQKAFINDPQWLLRGLPNVAKGRRGRLYRTGDLVRYIEDGQIDYIGRRDSQVKLRGQRIELGEIAAHLQMLLDPSRPWCVDVARLPNNAELLVLFLVIGEDEENTPRDVIRSTCAIVDPVLRKKLPAAMIPGAYARLGSIPLTLTGKTDRSQIKRSALALSANEIFIPAQMGHYGTNGDEMTGFSVDNDCVQVAASVTNMQVDGEDDMKLKTLKLLIAEVFGIDYCTISSSDTFFSLGGESLAAITLVGAAARKGLRLDVATIFRFPQLLQLASKCHRTNMSIRSPPKAYALLGNDPSLSDLAQGCGTSIDDIEDAYPATPLQQGLITSENRSAARYTGRQVLLLSKHVDPERLAHSWTRVAGCHTILRTRIVDTTKYGLVQVVLKNADLSTDIRASDLSDYLRRDDGTCMSLGTALCRWAIVREPNASYFVLTMHHAIYDGWTIPRLVSEVYRAYQGQPPRPRMGFNVFIEHVAALPPHLARDFWATKLGGLGDTTFYPNIMASADLSKSDSTVTQTVSIPTNSHSNTSMPTLLRAAWALLVSRFTDSDDVVFGTTVSGRNMEVEGIEGMLGPTISTIPLRVRIDRKTAVGGFIEAIQGELLEAMPFEYFGLQNIKKINQETRKRSSFTTLLIIQPPKRPLSRSESASASSSSPRNGLQSDLESLDLSASLADFNEYPLMIVVGQESQSLVLQANYDSRHFQQDEISHLLGEFMYVAEQLGQGQNTDTRLQDLQLASDRDTQTIWTWNAVLPQAVQDCVHTVIERTARVQPDATAVRGWDGIVTYSELEMLSARLSRVLQSRGVGPGSLVAICMEKSMWVPVAMLGILKSGAGFVLMDTRRQPKDRLRIMVEEAGAQVVVAAWATAKLASQLSQSVVVCNGVELTSAARDATHHSSIATPPSQPTPSDPAFIVFTSGSTGISKGIIIRHENFTSTIRPHAEKLRLSSRSCVYDFASYSFDIAIHNTLMTLSLGGCVCVPNEDDLENNIESSFQSLKANWVNLTPSVARVLDPTCFHGLDTLVLSGEPVGKDLIEQWAPKTSLINAYGPAECQICTVQAGLEDGADALRIGRGVGCATWIVDSKKGVLLPIGAVGELAIEGPIVSPGYINSSFEACTISNPDWLLKGAGAIPGRHGTLYRTGDLAYYLPDGTIRYVGRANTQVKINGQRVELEEIEFHTRRVLGPVDLVVDIVEIDDCKSICVFLSPPATGERPEGEGSSMSRSKPTEMVLEPMPTPPGLSVKLEQVMPYFMVPTVFLGVSYMPLTPSGKADRRKLKELAACFTRDQLVPSSPQHSTTDDTPILDSRQSLMRDAWSQILNIDQSRINPMSDFLQLGGDSISAMRLVKLCRSRGLSLKVSDVLRHSKLGDQCRLYNHSCAEDAGVQKAFTREEQPVRSKPAFALVSDSKRQTLIASAASVCKVPAHRIIDIYPTVPFQEGLLALTTADPSLYVQHTKLRLGGNYSIDRALAAWDSVIERTAILRTRIFQSDDGDLMQVVIRETQDWPKYDSCEAVLESEQRTPMGLGTPLCRFALVNTGSEVAPEYTIVWSIHHALYDAWTLELVLGEVSRCYHAPGVLETARHEYGVFVTYVRNQHMKSEAWWRSKLADAADAAVFPSTPTAGDNKLGPASANSTIQQSLSLPRPLPPGCTFALLFRCVWAILAARHTGSEKVLFGETRLGRDIPVDGMDTMRGPTIATVPHCVAVNRDQTVVSMLNDLRETAASLQSFEHLGLSSISRLSESTQAACGFQTLLVIQGRGGNSTSTNDESIFASIDSLDDIRNFSNYNMTLVVNQQPKGCVVEVVFNGIAIAADLIRHLLWQMESIWESVCNASEGTSIRQLDSAGKGDLETIWQWNALVPKPVNKTMHELFGEQARINPTNLAISAHDGEMTYAELDRVSSILAVRLRSRDVGNGQVIPLCFEKSMWETVAMLAVLKTGAAFNVMDVTYPEERLELITGLLGSHMMLSSATKRGLAERLSNIVMVVDENIDACEPLPIGRRFNCPRPVGGSDDLMYICFTSGSTGLPKGVMVTHKNLASASVPQTGELGFGTRSRVYDFSSHAFDAHIWHTWWSLISGACLCIPSHEDRLGNLGGSMHSFRATVAFLTPSVARTISPKDVPTLKRLFLGGEALTPSDVSHWCDHVELWGGYGPTEATPVSLFSRLTNPKQATNVGKAIGLNTWICNPEDPGILTAIGAVGELVLEGPLVSLGYYRDDTRNKTSFLDNPEFLSNKRFGRAYRTGDLARYAFDGSIDFMGRADAQIKLRGQRIEPGEIEYHLKAIMGAETSVFVDAITHHAGRPMLVAFYAVSGTEHSVMPRVSDIQHRLRKRLQPYAIPEAFLPLDDIPTTHSGKVDRQQLRLMGPQILLRRTQKTDGIAPCERGVDNKPPRTAREILLRELWATCIGQTSLADDWHLESNFFDVGGDSIAAMKLSNLARRQGFSLAVQDIMNNPSLANMAAAMSLPREAGLDVPDAFSLIAATGREDMLAQAAAICDVAADSIVDMYPCTTLQTELFASTMRQPRAYIRRAVYEVPSCVDLTRLLRAWDAVVAHNAALRTRFVDVGGSGLMQVVVNGHEWGAASTMTGPFPDRGMGLGSPLSQLTVCHDQDLTKVVWIVHHAVYDGWSVQLIDEQLRAAYEGKDLDPTTPFSGFVRHCISQVAATASQYWETYLEGCDTAAAIYPRLASAAHRPRPTQTSKGILRVPPASGPSLQAIIYGSWALIVSSLTERDDVVFASTLSGRNAPVQGIERIVGPTIAPVPIRVRIGDRERPVRQYLAEIERSTVDMAPYQHLGTTRIESISAGARAACKFQTLIVVTPEINQEDEPDPEHPRTATYDVENGGTEEDAFHTFALLLFFTPTRNALGLDIVFDPNVLEEREIARLRTRLEAVICALGSENLLVSRVQCLGQDDLRDISHWNAVMPPASEQLLHDVIMEGFQGRHQKVAIDAWDCSLSYKQLDNLSRALAARLIHDHEVGRGSVVVIISPKSGYVPVAALAVLRAGAAFVPFDVACPSRRIKQVVEHVRPSLILAHKSCSTIAKTMGIPLLSFDKWTDDNGPMVLSTVIHHQVDTDAQPEDVSCILFTSGSTGVPKGVQLTHRALATAVSTQARSSGFHEDTRAFEFASYGFDVSWNMMFKILAAGGTLCVPSEDDRINDLAGALHRSEATLTELTATVARLLNPETLPHLETLILSGEPVHRMDFAHWEPHKHLIVCYGPSECTSVSTINTGWDGNGSKAGVGVGSGCITWIVDPDDHCRLRPVGAIGEILIEGPIVCKGYYGDEASTRERFVSTLPDIGGVQGNNSFGESNGNHPRRGFKSGDLAFYDSEGHLHFVSRKDSQAKLHGQRIELEEVQRHVRTELGGAFTGTAVALVLDEFDVGAAERLAVFLSSDADNARTACMSVEPCKDTLQALESLDERLYMRLPSYMVPSIYFFIKSIPRTMNGKVDLVALKLIASQSASSQRYHGRPRQPVHRREVSTPTEITIRQLWADALRLDPRDIRADDTFISLNGDSISAMRLVTIARKAKLQLRVSDVLSHTKLSELALTIQQRDGRVDALSSTTTRQFSLLGCAVDTFSIRAEVAAKCDLSDPALVEDVFPCTPLQESMFAASVQMPGAFMSMRLYQVPPSTDVARFRTAWAVAYQRNPILRTRLVDLSAVGLSQAVIREEVRWKLYTSMGSFLTEERATATRGQVGTPLVRLALIEEPPREYRLVVVIHHALYDGWVLPMLEDEVQRIYRGELVAAPKPDIRPFVKHLLLESKESTAAFWKRELQQADRGAVVFPPLPSYNYAPKPDSYMQRVISTAMHFPSASISLSPFLYATYSLLVSRLLACRRVTFGAILTGRNAAVGGIDTIMGPTITTVPILVDVDPELSAMEFLGALREKTLNMAPHQHHGIRGIRRISEASASACGFQTVLVIQPPLDRQQARNKQEVALMTELDETKVEAYPDQHGILNQYGLMMEIIPSAGQYDIGNLVVRSSYDSGLISRPQMERFLSQWEHVMKQVACSLEGSTQSIAATMPSQDLNDIWCRNHEVPKTHNCLIHERISELANSNPKNLAVDAWDGQLTYHKLDTLSSSLAKHLVEIGVGVGAYVPLLFTKSIWANVSMLAVLKAGGAFVPLDAHHPEGHLRSIMQPLSASIILCSAHTRDRAARLAPQALLVDEPFLGSLDVAAGAGESKDTATVSKNTCAKPRDIAYAVFTSGSTGAAKGVKISHTNLSTAIQHQAGIQGYGLDSHSRTLDSSSYAFDACVCNFFYTLSRGGCLCVPSDEALKGDIGQFMRLFKVNWAQLVPSVSRTIKPASVPDLKCLVLTGEPITQGDIRTWAGSVRLINAYGPTECTILCAISSAISRDMEAGNIGRGRGANLWLTEIGNPEKLVPVGAVGEIMIEGPIIGVGYLGPYQYPLVTDPPWLLAGSQQVAGRKGRLFRTGDKARLNEDGTMTIIGRIGMELKLRGQRIDLLGIEDSVRRGLPPGFEIAADVIKATWGQHEQEKQVLLVFVSDTQPSATRKNLVGRLKELAPDLRRSLGTTLPSSLRPEALFPIASMPKTMSAKTDRRRLKELGKSLRPQQLVWLSGERAEKTSGLAPPMGNEERALAKLWAIVLHVGEDSISREDDFFQLGGDSLFAMQLTTTAHEQGLRLRVADVFKTPQLLKLARKVKLVPKQSAEGDFTEQAKSYAPYSLAIRIDDMKSFVQSQVPSELGIPQDDIEDVFPANGFQIDYINNQDEPLGLQYAYLDIGSAVSWPRLISSCQAVVHAFPSLRTRFMSHAGRYYQILLRQVPLLTEELSSETQVTTFSNWFCPTDCRTARLSDVLTKLTLVNFPQSRRRVIFRMSHMQNDGWCISRILHALQLAYNGEAIPSTPSWAALLHYRQKKAEASRAYWRRLLQGAKGPTPPLLFKPRDKDGSCPAAGDSASSHGVRTLRTQSLLEFHAASKNRLTRPTVVLNVAWALVLQQLAGHDDVVFANVTTGRHGDMPGVESVIGPCVNMVPMRLRLAAGTRTEEMAGSRARAQFLRDLVEISAQQVDGRMDFEGLDWEDMVGQCTPWSRGEAAARYSSAVHFRNMVFEPELTLVSEEGATTVVDRLVAGWYELVAAPHWTTVLAYPEDGVLRLWLLAHPAEIGDEGGDEILQLLSGYVGEIVDAISGRGE